MAKKEISTTDNKTKETKVKKATKSKVQKTAIKGDKTLVIVESPSKAKTINGYLGSKYKVIASVGHIKDLEKHNLGIDIDNDFTPRYIVVRGKAPLIKELKKESSAAKEVLIATDPDREGEAIAWHIADTLKEENSNLKRVLFNEITKDGVKKGISEPRDIDFDLFMSQQTRRVLDRLIGFKVSPFLSRALLNKTSKSLSAGRVQSVALRLICERDEEINNFKPIKYWSIVADFLDTKNALLNARLVAFDNQSIKNPEGSADDLENLKNTHYIQSEEQAKELIEKIKNEKFQIDDIIKRTVKRNPQPPFTTSSMQQEASKRLGFSNKRTMAIAQKLYEGVSIGSEGTSGLITYMRTDSIRISPDAENSAKDFILEKYGLDYIISKPYKFTTKAGKVQDGHEAIRPTSLGNTPDKLKEYLTKEELKLYQLIYNRFLASQMSQSISQQTTVNIGGGEFIFRLSGSILIFDGFLAVYKDIIEDKQTNEEENDYNIKLPKYLAEGMKLLFSQAEYSEKSTKSKPRYTEASLIKELDEKGIGRPSTYVMVISTLLEREYCELINKSFYPTELGIDVNKVLIDNFPYLFQVKFTAEMENNLDSIAAGTETYLHTINNFYSPFMKTLDKALKGDSVEKIICEKCGSEMVIKVSRKGRFLGCSNFPDCKNSKSLPKGKSEQKAEPVIAEGITCDLCGKEMLIRESKYGKFYGCIDFPKCKGIKQITTPGIKCPKCLEGSLTERYSPSSRKKFWGCTNYPECDYITNNEPYPQTCSNCHNKFLEIKYRKYGANWEKYLICPKCKAAFEIKNEKENENSEN